MLNKSQTNRAPDAQTMKERYQRAQGLMQGIWSSKIAFNDILYPFWIGDSDCFWYMRTTKNGDGDSTTFGHEYRLVDAKKTTNQPAFDHRALAAALSESIEKKIDGSNLPITNVEMYFDSPSSPKKLIKTVYFTAFDQRWVFDTVTTYCAQVDTTPKEWEISPDGRYAVFTRDFNLWLYELESGEEHALTSDGEDNYIYGYSGSGWGYVAEPRVQARWSKDSNRIFTVQHDARQVKDLPVVHYVPKDGSIRPTVENHKIAYPGDSHIATLRLLCIDVKTSCIQDANYRHIPVTRNSLGLFSSNLGWWGADNRRAYFVDVERDYKTVRVVEFDTNTGDVKELFKETTDTQINLMLNGDEQPTFVPMPETSELLWFSERSGWAHLYLYNLETGELKNTITQGDWVVRQVVHVDKAKREVYIQTGGRVSERDPYYRDLCRVHLDTGELAPLISSDHDIFAVTYKDINVCFNLSGFPHDLSGSNGISPTGDFAVVTRSRVDEVPVSFLVDQQGGVLLELEVADVSALPDNWQWPEPCKLLAADDRTDIYGVVFRPSNFSSKTSYPILTLASSPSPDFPIVPKGSFCNGIASGYDYFMAAALAELGFVVLIIDTRGASYRCKAFKDESYGWVESACNFEDLIAGTQQIARRYCYMDLNRVGIVTTSGGPGGLQGLLQHPDFYKVGISHMLHDCRLMSAPMWGEMYEGILDSNTDRQYPEEMVEKLQGKLLLIDGMLDTVTPPSGIFRVVEALQKANKDFDLLLLPNLEHDISSYVVRRIWDYLVKFLLGTEPPREFKLTADALSE